MTQELHMPAFGWKVAKMSAKRCFCSELLSERNRRCQRVSCRSMAIGAVKLLVPSGCNFDSHPTYVPEQKKNIRQTSRNSRGAHMLKTY